MIICKVCKRNKEMSCFIKNNSNCKDCRAEYYKKYYEKNKKLISKNRAEYYKNNKEKYEKWRSDRKKAKPDYKLHYSRKYRELNREKVREYHRNYEAKRKKICSTFHLIKKLRTRLNVALKYKCWDKNSSFTDYIGCNKEELVSHIEKQFVKGMSWENRSLWHFDHKIPLATAKTKEQLLKLCHYTNLQPLWAQDNLKKGKKVL